MERLKRCWDQRLRDPSFERDGANGFSWPQRSYRCSFCSKEFMSAQALGGHMNVHRRDRARMRGLYPNTPNPNPNLPSTSSDVIKISPSSPSLQEDGIGRSLTHNITALLGEDVGKQNEWVVDLESTHFTTKNGARVQRAKELIVKLDLNLGSLIQEAKEGSDLDLELRL